MKQTTPLWLALALVAAGQPQNALAFSESFETYPVGVFPAAWQLVYNGAGTSQQYVNNTYASTGTNSLHLLGSYSWSSVAFRPVAFPDAFKVTGRVWVNDISPPGMDDGMGSISLYNPTLGTWGTWYGGVTLRSDGNFVLGDTLVPCGLSQWHAVAMYFDLNQRVFYASVDSSQIAGPFAMPTSGNPSGVALYSGHGSQNIWFDDVAVTSWTNATPLIVIQPTSRTNDVGTTAGFSAFAIGSEPLYYQWRYYGTNLANTAYISGVTTTNLTMTNVQLTDAGDYSVIVTNAFGSVTSSVAGLMVVANQPITNGLVAYYPFDGNANDISGKGNDGIVYGAALTTDRFGHTNSAYYFNGTSSYIRIPQSSSLSNLQNVTISYWVKYYRTTSGNYQVSMTICNGQDRFSPPGFWTYATASQLMHFLGQQGSSAANVNIPFDATVPLDQQSFVFVTFIANPTNILAYKNGVLQGTSDRQSLPIARPNFDWFIGTSGDFSFYPYYLNGMMDDIRIYNRALSDSEILQLYVSEAGITNTPAALTLGIALDNTNHVWSTSGSANWFAQTNVTHDGVDAAQSGPVGQDQTSTLSTTLTGPGTLTFWGKVNSSSSYGNLVTVYMDGVWETSIYGHSNYFGWQEITLYIGSGNHLMSWEFWNRNIGTNGNAGWLDQVTYEPGGTAPIVETYFTRVPSWLGGQATFEPWAVGTPPFVYELLKDGTVVVSGTNSTVVLTNIQPADTAGNFSLRVTNDHGATVISNLSIYLTPIAAWGYNDYGQCRTPEGLSNIVQIATGWWQSLALQADGRVVEWGYTAGVPADLTNAIAIAAGAYHSLAVRMNGTVEAWGENWGGQTDVPDGLTNVVAVTGGYSHSLALLSDGTVIPWGGYDDVAGFVPMTVPAGLSNVSAIASGGDHCLALCSNGLVVAWGNNSYDQTNVPASLSNVVAVSCGHAHSLALCSNGTVVAWGANWDGQTNVPAGLSNIVAVASGHSHSLALRSDGAVIAWGLNDYGQATVPGGVNSAKAVASGVAQNLVLLNQRPAVVVPSPITLGSATINNGIFNFHFTNTSGATFTVLTTTNISLPSSNWTVHGGATEVSPGQFQFTDSHATNNPQRFYRVRSP